MGTEHTQARDGGTDPAEPGTLSASAQQLAGAKRPKGMLWRVALLVVVLAILDQGLQHVLMGDGMFRGRRVAPFDPPLFNTAQAESLERLEALADDGTPLTGNVTFDALLGWAPEAGGGSGQVRYDWAGARLHAEPIAEERGLATRRIVTIGGSFTHGDEVGAAETWSAQLADRFAADPARTGDGSSLEVANLGVGGYGIDQALLRLRRDGLALGPDEVWLGLMPGACLRVVNQYRPALRHHDRSVAFKPRFILDNADDLVLIHSPAESPADAVRLIRRQDDFMRALVEHDLFVRRVPQAYMRTGTSWMHWFAPTRLLLTRTEGRMRDPAEWLGNLDSEVTRLMHELVLTTAHDARTAGAVFRVIVLPDRKSLRSLEPADEDQPPYWDGLVNGLRLADIDVVDLTQPLLDAGALDDDEFWMPGGHYSPRANAVVANALAPIVGASEIAVDSADYFSTEPGTREFSRIDKPKRKKTLIVAPAGAETTSGSNGDDRVAHAAGKPVRHVFAVPDEDEPGDGQGLRLVFAQRDERLLLEAFTYKNDKIDTGLVELATPALVGTDNNHLGAAPHLTGVDQTCRVQANLLGTQTLDVDLTGTIAASWVPSSPITIGDVTHDDVVGLRLVLDLALAADVLGVPFNRDARLSFSGVLAREEGYVEYSSRGKTYRLEAGAGN